jgi:hypothetical protein
MHRPATSRAGRRLRGCAFGAVAAALSFVACTDGSRPSLADSPPPPSPTVMATQPPVEDPDETATTLDGGGPFSHSSGVRVDLTQPCAFLSPTILELLGFDPVGEPRSPAAGKCKVETDDGPVQVTLTEYPDAGREHAFTEYSTHRDPVNLDTPFPGEVPGCYFRGTAEDPQPEFALFPDNAWILVRLPASPADTSLDTLSAILLALEHAV